MVRRGSTVPMVVDQDEEVCRREHDRNCRLQHNFEFMVSIRGEEQGIQELNDVFYELRSAARERIICNRSHPLPTLLSPPSDIPRYEAFRLVIYLVVASLTYLFG